MAVAGRTEFSPYFRLFLFDQARHRAISAVGINIPEELLRRAKEVPRGPGTVGRGLCGAFDEDYEEGDVIDPRSLYPAETEDGRFLSLHYIVYDEGNDAIGIPACGVIGYANVLIPNPIERAIYEYHVDRSLVPKYKALIGYTAWTCSFTFSSDPIALPDGSTMPLRDMIAAKSRITNSGVNVGKYIKKIIMELLAQQYSASHGVNQVVLWGNSIAEAMLAHIKNGMFPVSSSPTLFRDIDPTGNYLNRYITRANNQGVYTNFDKVP